MLKALHDNDGRSLPSTMDVAVFAGQIDTACVGSDATVSMTAARIYVRSK